eukprot:TRINITY_DN64549_c0_g1_i1.p1 TRINITY_DN64549_c0_g1~~TRINITY_DN64549_c0_g1_i1.p1  ORF type:complete len:694 (-),score=74.22 TRINITY_DN64549_c0_g1_i1:79-1986(-)
MPTQIALRDGENRGIDIMSGFPEFQGPVVATEMSLAVPTDSLRKNGNEIHQKVPFSSTHVSASDFPLSPKPVARTVLAPSRNAGPAVSKIRAKTAVLLSTDLRPTASVQLPLISSSVASFWQNNNAEDRFLFYRKLASAGDPASSLIIGALAAWTLVLLWLLQTTTRDFFLPVLVYWCDLLQLRPELMGATLVAFVNCVPETLSMRRAARQDNMALGLCELFGSNMCIICVAGSGVLLARHHMLHQAHGRFLSESTAIDARSLAPNIAFYAVFLVCFGIWCQSGTITTVNAAVLLVLYILYVLMFIVDNRYASLFDDLPGREKRSLSDMFRIDSGVGRNPYASPPTLPGLAWPSDGTIMERSAAAFAWPTYFFRWLFIPPADKHWDRTRRAFSALCPTVLALCWLFSTDVARLGNLRGDPDKSFRAFVSGIAMSATLLFWFCSDDGPRMPRFYPIITLLTLMSSTVTLGLLAGELAAVVETLAVFAGVPTAWLASTVVAWSNSIGDFFMLVTMVQHGQQGIALTSLFAGPLFNCLMGVSASLCSTMGDNGGILQLWHYNMRVRSAVLASIGFMGVACSVILTVLALKPMKYRLWPLQFAAIMLLSLYAVYVTSMFSIEGVPRPIPRNLLASVVGR